MAGHFAAAALMLLLAGVLLWLDASSRPVRAFVAFLVLRAGAGVATPIVMLVSDSDPTTVAALASSVVYVHFAAAGAVLWFIATFPHPAPPIVRAGILSLTVAAEAVLALRRCWVICDGSLGPLAFLLQALPLSIAAAAIWFLFTARRMTPGVRRSSTTVLGIAFAIESALWAGIGFPLGGVTSADWPFFAGLAVAAFAGSSLNGRLRLLVLGALLGAGVTSFVATHWTTILPASIGFFARGLWRLALPALAAYALLRHRLFDLDIRVRLATQRATIGAIFAGVFFVVTEGSAYVLGSQFGVLAGILAVGALVPAMGPLRRAAERIANFLPGDVSPAKDLPIERRREIYHEFALQAWADGSLAREERLFLDSVRERLGLSADDALRLESEASRTTQGG